MELVGFRSAPARTTSKSEAQCHAAPIMQLLDLLGRRWTLRVLWELRDGPVTFAALREAGEISTSVLTQRLRELGAAGLIERSGDGRYALTAHGRELGEQLLPLHAWAERWARER